ncbi:MAG: cyanophycin synthetase [Candidatus Solibacter usitatus]|nr:cyanophycin synthetase [Candidatus Solibacter usitatus]
MEFRKVLALRGPNIWANFPVIEAWVDLGELNDKGSDEIPGFNERLMSWLPSMVEHRCSVGERGGFFERLRRGTYLAHILEHVTLELQALSGVEVSYGRARSTAEHGVYKITFKYKEETHAKACLEAARELCLAAVNNTPFDVAATVEKLTDLAESRLLGPSTNAIVQAARRRNIPFHRLNRHSLVQFGYGSKQRRIRAAETDQTGSIAESIAQDKDLTRQLLQAAGVPVAEGYVVDDAEDAWSTAQSIGVPVVVKPQDGNQGRGVATNLTTEEQVKAAYAAASEESSSVMVEKFAQGHDYRLLVVGDKLVAAARREPAQVMGDGVHTIEYLVDVLNQDPRRGEHHAKALSKVHIDQVALNVLTDQGYTPQSAPAKGEVVYIRRNANLSTGGQAIDVTDQVHPEVAARAVDAARVIGLDITGVDIIASDITVPLEEQGGIIVEINAAPGLRMHLAPSVGDPRPVGEAIVDLLYKPEENGRIPIVAVTGINGKTTVTRFVAHLLKGNGKRIGMTCTDGIYVGDRRIDSGDCSGPLSARNVLMNPNVDAAVFETARGGVLRAGLAFNECDVAVVTNIGEGDHLGLSDINTPEDLAKVKRVIVDVVGENGTAVLNATDPLVVGMAPHCPGKVMYFAIDGDHPVLAAHRREGGRAIFVRDGEIVVSEEGREQVITTVGRVPLTYKGRIAFEVENTLAALAAAWCLGIPNETLAVRSSTFGSDMSKVPGRFNILEIKGATVVVDYGHNMDALKAMISALETFPGKRRVALYSAAGDRRDADMVAMGKLIGGYFDRVILYEGHYMRGRKQGEIIDLFRKGMEGTSKAKQVEGIIGPVAAVEHTLNTLEPGDVVLLQADEIDETMDYMRHYLAKMDHAPEPLEVKFHEPHGPDLEADEDVPVMMAPARVYMTWEYCNGVYAEAPLGAKPY